MTGTLQRRKIDEAARRLIHGTETIASIARDLGFDSAALFSRVFRRVTGMTPSACRQRQTLPV